MNQITTPPCPLCGTSIKLNLTETESASYMMWKDSGKLVQECFPARPPEWRELLITGMHPDCWDLVLK
jgi:hypothetical protein